MNRPLIILGLLLTLGLIFWQVQQKEIVIDEGRLLLLELAPVDPRSLMQGDYMVLRYAIARELSGKDWPEDGLALLRVDANGVGQLLGQDIGQPLASDQLRLRYRRRSTLRIGAESFFFEEGSAESYNKARYGGLRVDSSGESVLIGLYDADRQLLSPNSVE